MNKKRNRNKKFRENVIIAVLLFLFAIIPLFYYAADKSDITGNTIFIDETAPGARITANFYLYPREGECYPAETKIIVNWLGKQEVMDLYDLVERTNARWNKFYASYYIAHDLTLKGKGSCYGKTGKQAWYADILARLGASYGIGYKYLGQHYPVRFDLSKFELTAPTEPAAYPLEISFVYQDKVYYSDLAVVYVGVEPGTVPVEFETTQPISDYDSETPEQPGVDGGLDNIGAGEYKEEPKEEPEEEQGDAPLGGGFAPLGEGIKGCTEITIPGVYDLDQDILNSLEATCIQISTSDVVFDGGGFTIDSDIPPTTTYGIFISSGLTNVTVKNVKLTDWTYGIYGSNLKDSNILNNDIISSGNIGINFNEFNNSNLSYNNVSLNQEYGFRITGGYSNSIDNNIISETAGSTSKGLYLHSSDSNVINNNNITNNNWDGLALLYSDNNDVYGNFFNSNIYSSGIYISQSSGNTIRSNQIIGNKDGIYSSSSDNLVLSFNRVCDNQDNDFYSAIWPESFGLNNSCDNYGIWNDTDYIGCTWYCNGSEGQRTQGPQPTNFSIDSCRKINESGVYTFIEDIIDSTLSVCINITVDNVVIEGNNKLLDGTDHAGSGILAENPLGNLKNITVKNLRLTDWGTAALSWHAGAIEYLYVDDGLVENIDARSNLAGIILVGGNNSVVTGNTIFENGIGFYHFQSNFSEVSNNNITSSFYDNTIYDIMSDNCGFSMYEGNYFSGVFLNFYLESYFINNYLLNSIGEFSFIGEDLVFQKVYVEPSDPDGYSNIGRYINVSRPDEESWLAINFSYEDSELGNLDESTLQLARYNGTWELDQSKFANSFDVDTTNNIVYANITGFGGANTIFTVLGERPTFLVTLTYPGDGDTLEKPSFPTTQTFKFIPLNYINGNLSCGVFINGTYKLNDYCSNNSECSLTVGNLSERTYSWHIMCFDELNNSANSTTREFTLEEYTSGGNNGGGGGGGGGSSVCGNGDCEIDESFSNCCKDCGCPTGQTCVDNICTTTQLTGPYCGNNACDGNETYGNCCIDCLCPADKACKNNVCTPLSETCGDTICQFGETVENCPLDCSNLPTCGDNVCNSADGENQETCCQDCGCQEGFVCKNGKCFEKTEVDFLTILFIILILAALIAVVVIIVKVKKHRIQARKNRVRDLLPSSEGNVRGFKME